VIDFPRAAYNAIRPIVVTQLDRAVELLGHRELLIASMLAVAGQRACVWVPGVLALRRREESLRV